MKTVNWLFILTVCISIIILHSCDCAYLNEYTIINNSAGPIKVEVSSSCEKDIILYIPQDSSQLICSDYTGATSCSGPYKNYLGRQIYNLNIYLNDTVKGIKNYSDKINWDFYEKNRSGQFELTITDEDF